MPDYADFAVTLGRGCLDGPLDCMPNGVELVVACDDLRETRSSFAKHGEIMQQIEEAPLFENSFDQDVEFGLAFRGDHFAIGCAPGHEPFLIGGQRADPRGQPIGGDKYSVRPEKRWNLGLVGLKLVVCACQCRVFTTWRFEFNHAKRQPIDENYDSAGFRTVGRTVDQVIGHGLAVVGVVQGAVGAVQSYSEGDRLGVAVNSVTAFSGLASVTKAAADALGKELPGTLRSVVKGGAEAAPFITIADGVYQVAHEKGNFYDHELDGSLSLGNKGQRMLVAGGTIMTGSGLALAGLGTGGIAVAVAGVGYVGKMSLENHRALKDLDRRIDAGGQATRNEQPAGTIKASADPNAPDLRRYKHVAEEMFRVSADIHDSEIKGKLDRSPHGKILATAANMKVMADPENLKILEKAIAAHEKREETIAADNDSVLPKFLRLGDEQQAKLERQTRANMEIADAKGAEKEIGMYRAELNTYLGARHAQINGPAEGDVVAAGSIGERGRSSVSFNSQAAGQPADAGNIVVNATVAMKDHNYKKDTPRA